MHKPNDLTGQKFGRLTGLRFLQSERGNARWLFICECGRETSNLANNVRRSLTQSCGCLRKESLGQSRIHGNGHRGKFSSEYKAYRGAKIRCTNPSFSKWNRYGGRGIEFRFSNFKDFLAAVGPKPPGTELDRINNDGHYEVGNLRWISHRENCQNRSYGLH